MTRPRAVCERSGCEERATASAYGLLLCIGCYSEHGLDSALLLGGRRPIFARPETDPRLLDVLGSEDAAVERLIEVPRAGGGRR